MSLRNLNQLAKESQESYSNYNKEEVILTQEFKDKYTQYFHSKNKGTILFVEHTAILTTKEYLTITFPNQWFYIASYFTEYLIALKEYKELYTFLFKSKSKSESKLLVTNFRDDKSINSDIIQKIETHLSDNNDAEYFKKFLSDYDWWYGQKTIDRGDYYVSPILNLAKVVNASQSYIVDLVDILSEKPELLETLKNSKLNPIIPKEQLDDLTFDLDLFELELELDFNISIFQKNCASAHLKYSNSLITRYISSLVTKPFVLLSGLSGSGKTKLAQSFAQWICEDKNQYCIVSVGADWTNREPLLGYVNALDGTEYILPENGALKLLIEANKEENQNKPYFLILDEMNLSHVERYFADFLSVMESKDKFKLHSSEDNLNITDGDKHAKSIEVPNALSWSKNLFVVGTVNIDETTYMFSPKVLDRANAIEFKVSKTDIEKFLADPKEIDLTQLEFKGASMGTSFIEIAKNKKFDTVDTKSLNKTLVSFFDELTKTGAEFGYRTGMEIHRLYKQISVIDETIPEKDIIDIAVMQKLLPKLHGSRRKLCPILETLAKLCVKESIDVKKDFLDNKEVLMFKGNPNVNYPLSLEKITRMYKGAIDNGFASYAEA